MQTSNKYFVPLIDKQRVYFTFIISYIYKNILLQVLKKEYTHL